MKKNYFVFLALLTAVCITGSTVALATGTAALPNPVREVTLEALQTELGFPFQLPEEATDVAYTIINGAEGQSPIAQADFTMNEAQMTCRKQKVEALTDISGMHYDWTKTGVTAFEGVEDAAISTNGEQGILLWYDAAQGITYSLSMNAGASEDALVDVAAKIMLLPSDAAKVNG